MKNYNKKILIYFLSICSIGLVQAQSISNSQLLHEIQRLQKKFVPDKRVAILEIEFTDMLNSTFVVKGKTDLPEAKLKIIELFRDNNFQVIDSITLLPDASLGDKTWALSTLSVSNMRAKPDDASELVSQTTMGTPLRILEQREKWFLVQSPEKYLGWMDAAGLQQLTLVEIEKWKSSNRCFFTQTNGYLIAAPQKNGEIISDLVRGDLLEIISSSKSYFNVKIPDGRTGYVKKDNCTSFNELCNSKATAQSLIEVARQMMGSPYLWGGASTKAADCSGFVKLAYFSQGLILARDASQQALYGDSIDIMNHANLKQGDLLFFGKTAQRITHVGIYLGKSDFIHASGRVHISSIDPADSKFVSTRNLVAARRILNPNNADGIIKVKEHPWYSINR